MCAGCRQTATGQKRPVPIAVHRVLVKVLLRHLSLPERLTRIEGAQPPPARGEGGCAGRTRGIVGYFFFLNSFRSMASAIALYPTSFGCR
jgi:hypothetical protein